MSNTITPVYPLRGLSRLQYMGRMHTGCDPKKKSSNAKEMIDIK